MEYFGHEILPKLGEKEKIAGIAPTENIRVDAKKMYEDFTFVMQNGKWYHYEFESDALTTDDLRRFREYEAFTSMVHHVDVVTHVVCTADTGKKCTELKTGINIYRVKVSYTRNEKAEDLFARIQTKNPKELTRQELVEIIFSPLLGGSMPKVERFLKGTDLLRAAGEPVSKEEISRMEAIFYILAVKFLSKDELDKVKERMGMTILGQMIFEDGEAKGVAKGQTVGEMKEKIRSIRKMNAKGMDISTIIDILDEERILISDAVDLMEKYPDKSDLELAKMMLEEKAAINIDK